MSGPRSGIGAPGGCGGWAHKRLRRGVLPPGGRFRAGGPGEGRDGEAERRAGVAVPPVPRPRPGLLLRHPAPPRPPRRRPIESRPRPFRRRPPRRSNRRRPPPSVYLHAALLLAGGRGWRPLRRRGVLRRHLTPRRLSLEDGPEGVTLGVGLFK